MSDRLVVQLPLVESTDFDSLIGIENGLLELFKKNGGADVDGHDIGRGKFNMFIRTNESWPSTLGRIRAFLEFQGVLESALVARDLGDGKGYEVLWPTGYRGKFEP